MRRRVSAARDRGIYVSVPPAAGIDNPALLGLFEGWAMQFSAGAWEGHPFHQQNNVNSIDGDQNKDGKGLEFHTLADPAVTALQEAYVRKVIDIVNDFDPPAAGIDRNPALLGVLYEISNENHPPSTEWQYHIIRYIKSYEKNGVEYLVYKPTVDETSITLKIKAGKYKYEWFDPSQGKVVSTGTIRANGSEQALRAPLRGDAVVYIAHSLINQLTN